MDPSDLEIKFPFVFRRTRSYVRKNKNIRKYKILMNSIIIFACVIPAGAWSYFNYYFYMLIILKFLVVASIPLHAISLVADSEEIIEYWKDGTYRKKIIREKLFYTAYQLIVLFLVSLAIFSIFHLTGMVDRWETQGILTPSYYNPSAIEGVLIAIVCLLSVVTMWLAAYWHSGSFAKIKRFSKEKESVVFDNLAYLALATGIVFLLFYIGLYLFLDDPFITLKAGGSFEGELFLKTIAETLGYWTFVIEIGVLVLINLVFYLMGRRGLNTRTNFVSEPTEIIKVEKIID